MKILVSKCLLGENCKYSGGNNKNERVCDLKKEHELFPVCPEELGGLPTPREPSERVGDKVLSRAGKDVTGNFKRGAEKTLELAKEQGITSAVLKANSPSCGKGCIYDGTFSGRKIFGNGVTAELLLKNGITVFTEEEI